VAIRGDDHDASVVALRDESRGRMMMGEGPGRADGVGDRHRREVAATAQRSDGFQREPSFTAEEVAATGHLQQ